RQRLRDAVEIARVSDVLPVDVDVGVTWVETEADTAIADAGRDGRIPIRRIRVRVPVRNRPAEEDAEAESRSVRTRRVDAVRSDPLEPRRDADCWSAVPSSRVPTAAIVVCAVGIRVRPFGVPVLAGCVAAGAPAGVAVVA